MPKQELHNAELKAINALISLNNEEDAEEASKWADWQANPTPNLNRSFNRTTANYNPQEKISRSLSQRRYTREKCKCKAEQEHSAELERNTQNVSAVLKKVDIWSGLDEESIFWKSHYNWVQRADSPDKQLLLKNVLSNQHEMSKYKNQTYSKIRKSLKIKQEDSKKNKQEEAQFYYLQQNIRETYHRLEARPSMAMDQNERQNERSGKIRLLLKNIREIKVRQSNSREASPAHPGGTGTTAMKKEQVSKPPYMSNLLKIQTKRNELPRELLEKSEKKIINMNAEAEKLHAGSRQPKWRLTNRQRSFKLTT